jgi:hypothetical protein
MGEANAILFDECVNNEASRAEQQPAGAARSARSDTDSRVFAAEAVSFFFRAQQTLKSSFGKDSLHMKVVSGRIMKATDQYLGGAIEHATAVNVIK